MRMHVHMHMRMEGAHIRRRSSTSSAPLRFCRLHRRHPPRSRICSQPGPLNLGFSQPTAAAEDAAEESDSVAVAYEPPATSHQTELKDGELKAEFKEAEPKEAKPKEAEPKEATTPSAPPAAAAVSSGVALTAAQRSRIETNRAAALIRRASTMNK